MGSAQEPLWVMIGGDRSHSNSSANARAFGGKAGWNPNIEGDRSACLPL